MTCSIAIASSPVFSTPMISLSCKSSPEALTMGINQHQASASADGPFRRFHRVPSSLRVYKNDIPMYSSPGLDSSVASPSSSSSTSATSGFSSALSSSLSGCASFPKRKRPARLNIPIMGLMSLDLPLRSDGRQEVEEECERYSIFCKRGKKRLEMEDRHSAAVNLRGEPQMAFFGIYDGHGGFKAADYVSKNIGDLIFEEIAMMRGEKDALDIEEAVANGYKRTDSEFLKEKLSGGTCCVTALMRNGELIVSNAGDCRAVLSISGTAEALTSDHRPSRLDEKDRIESLGGYIDCYRGVWRLQGSLAVSRGIGDSHLKQWVIPDPETRKIRIEPDCEFVILASDGLWDKVSNQEAVDMARPLCFQQPSALSACKKLVEHSISRGSTDDISVMIIQLGHFFTRKII